MTSQPLYMKPHQVWVQHIHLTCDITATLCVIPPTILTISNPLLLSHHTHHICDIICIIQDIIPSLFDLKPPFWGHHNHYVRKHFHSICVITQTLSKISQPLCVLHHIHYMWDLLSAIFMISYTLCMTSQPCVLISPHSAYVWRHLLYRRHHIHAITTSYNLYDFISTSGMTSHHL